MSRYGEAPAVGGENELPSDSPSPAMLGRVLDGIPEGVLVVDGEGRLRFANAAGRRLLGRDEPFSQRDGQLCCREEANDHVLRRAIERACGGDLQGAQAIVITRLGRNPLLLTIKRLGGLGFKRLALLLTFDPNPDAQALPVPLQVYFGLTPSEAQVAVAVAEGRRATAIAAQRHVAVDTVRTQIKRIAAKLGCARQSQIAAIVNALPPFLAVFPAETASGEGEKRPRNQSVITQMGDDGRSQPR